MRRIFLRNLLRNPLTEPTPAPDEAKLTELAQHLEQTSRTQLGRTLSIREVDANSCNDCELEIHTLNNILYDLEHFGLRFVASPRHADILFVTNPVTNNMRETLERTYRTTPNPKWIVAVGDCARDNNMFTANPTIVDNVAKIMAVDLHIPNCPPNPTTLLKNLLALVQTVK